MIWPFPCGHCDRPSGSAQMMKAFVSDVPSPAPCRCAHIRRRCRVSEMERLSSSSHPRTRAPAQEPSTCMSRSRAGTLERCEKESCRRALVLWRTRRPRRRSALDSGRLAPGTCGSAAPARRALLTTEARPRWRGPLQTRQVSASPPEDAMRISTGRGDGTRPRSRCVPAARDPAIDTFPTAHQDRARRPSRCSRRRRSRVRKRSCRGPHA
jgi:hypothetical protein